jgi:hypothetical protein
MNLGNLAFWRQPPIADLEGLAAFVDEQSAFLVQKGIYEWQAQKAQTGRSPPAKQIMPGRDKHQPRNTLQGRPGCAVPRQLLCPAPCNMSCPTSPRAERRPIIGRRGLMIQAMQCKSFECTSLNKRV